MRGDTFFRRGVQSALGPCQAAMVLRVVAEEGRTATSCASPLLKPLPNTYEVPRCQETDAPSERILPIFFRCAAGQAQSASGNVCSVCMAVCWCTNVTAPHPACG